MSLFTLPKVFHIAGSTIYPGAKLYFYSTGTTTDATAYTDSARSVAHSQPVVSDANGVFEPIWLDPTITYRVQLKTSADVLIYDVDPYPGVGFDRAEVGGVLYPVTAAETAAGLTSSDLVMYYAPGDIRRYGTNTTPGTTDMTTAIQNAIDSNATVYLQDETYLISSAVVLDTGQFLRGKGPGKSIISRSGTGTAVSFVSASGTGTRIYNGGVSGLQISTSTAGIGLDLDSVSEADFTDVIVNGFSTAGIRLHSSTSGGATYNRFYSVKAQACGIGFDLIRDGSGTSSYTNATSFIACRVNSCTTGFNISGGNENVIHASQIEGCTTGVTITEPATATCNRNVVSLTRFENNTTDVSVGTGVVETVLHENYYVSGDLLTDSGTRTQNIGTNARQYLRSSGYQVSNGSFRWVRTANGGTQVPHTVFSDDNTTNSPTTVQIQNAAASTDARAFRVKYGTDATGNFKFGIVPISGKIMDLSTTNGPVGSFTMGAAATTVVANTCITASSLIFLQPYNAAAATLVSGSKSPYISARTADTSFTVATADASAAAGTEIFVYWIVN